MAPAVAHSQAQKGPTVITGTVLDPEGKPLVMADVHLELLASRHPIAESRVEADGRYAIATAASGPVFLRFTGVDHLGVLLPLILAPPATMTIDVRLKRYVYGDSLDKVVAIGDWNDFNFGTGRPLVKQPDGRYTLDIQTTADTVAYQLLGLATGERSINGTNAARYVYDGGGDYRSVLKAGRGHATLVFDPKRLDRRPGEGRVTFGDPTSTSARLAAAYDTTRNWLRTYFDAATAARQAHDSLRYDWSPTVRRLSDRLEKEQDPLLRQLYLFTALETWSLGGQVDTTIVRRGIQEIPPESPWWSFLDVSQQKTALVLAAARLRYPGRSYRDLYQDSTVARQAVAFLDLLIARNPDPDVRSGAIAEAVFFLKSIKDDQRANEYYLRLVSTYPEAPEVASLKARYAPDRVLRVGAQVPDFRFHSFDDSNIVYSRTSLMGKPYLLEFWATWCGPCIGEMPTLQSAYDSVSKRGLQFLSISLDRNRDDVRKFRADKWKMPWLNAFVPGEFDSPEMRQFEIVFIPRAALIGADGTILATDEELRGDLLLPTLQKALGLP